MLPVDASGGRRWHLALLVMVASGFAGLGYQIVWTQQSALWLGHESASVLAVVAAFFGGLAAGALTLGSRIEKSAHPARWYAGCELVIALWSLVLAVAMARVSTWMLRLTGVQPSPLWQWMVAFVGTFLLLLPATAAMGATLPAMERVAARLSREGRSIAPLYASNTFGAVMGVLAIAFWLVPELGLLRTAGVCVALNLLCALASLKLLSSAVDRVARADTKRLAGSQYTVLASLAVTGFLGIGYEVLVVRVLSQVEENTVYTFAMLLATYLTGTSAGAAGYQRWLVRRFCASRLDVGLLYALAFACLAGTASLWAAQYVKILALQTFGTSMAAALAAESVVALIAFGPATFVMGATFSHLGNRAVECGISFGRALGVNTLGAAMAPLVFGVLVLPALGAKYSLLLISLGYLLLAAWRGWKRPVAWVPVGAVLAVAYLAPPLAFIDVPAGGRVVSYREGVMAAVSVVEDAEGVARLRIDNRQQEGSSATFRVDARQALLPVLLHPAPKHALFLGLGTGVTATAATSDPALEVDAVELLPEVIAASGHFTRALQDGEPNPRLHLIAADARRYVRATDRRYEVIVSDNFHPARSGSGSLYTVEHFDAVRTRLADGGVFCQWLPLHQLDIETLRSIVQSFLAVYPDGSAILASNSLDTPVVGLIGRRDVAHFDVDAVRERLATPVLSGRLEQLGIEDELALLGSFIAGPKALERFAGSAVLNTDDHPVVAYRAPRITYAPGSQPRDRLIALLNELSIDPAELIAVNDRSTWASRLAAYWVARNRFIESGRGVRPVADVREILAQVREPLLSVLRISPDFRPAYDPLIRMAIALSETDVAGARALLTELQSVQPSRPEATRVLSQLAAVTR